MPTAHTAIATRAAEHGGVVDESDRSRARGNVPSQMMVVADFASGTKTYASRHAPLYVVSDTTSNSARKSSAFTAELRCDHKNAAAHSTMNFAHL
jgi:hypothetical protein